MYSHDSGQVTAVHRQLGPAQPEPRGVFGCVLPTRPSSYPVVLQWGTMAVVREIRWTSESEAHIARHGVTPEEVEQAINSKPRYETTGREDSTLVFCAYRPRATPVGRPG